MLGTDSQFDRIGNVNENGIEGTLNHESCDTKPLSHFKSRRGKMEDPETVALVILEFF